MHISCQNILRDIIAVKIPWCFILSNIAHNFDEMFFRNVNDIFMFF